MEAPRANEAPRPIPELASLRIRRDTERPKRPIGWLLLGSVGAVAVAVVAYFALSSTFGAVTSLVSTTTTLGLDRSGVM